MADTRNAPDTRTSDDLTAARAKPLPRHLPLTADPPDLVPARMINEVLYCERLMYLEWSQGELADNAFTVDGRAVHAHADVPAGALPPVPPAGPTDEEDDEPPEPPSYEARSIWLSSEARGITAKLDVVESDASGRVVPIAYKRGAAPDVPAGALPRSARRLTRRSLIAPKPKTPTAQLSPGAPPPRTRRSSSSSSRTRVSACSRFRASASSGASSSRPASSTRRKPRCSPSPFGAGIIRTVHARPRTRHGVRSSPIWRSTRIAVHAIPHAQASPLGRLRIETNELAHAELVVTPELLVPGQPVALAGTHDLHGEIGGASRLPGLPGAKLARLGVVQADEDVGGEPPLGARRVPVHELIGTYRVRRAEGEAQEPEKERPNDEMLKTFGHLFLDRKMNRCRRAHMMQLGEQHPRRGNPELRHHLQRSHGARASRVTAARIASRQATAGGRRAGDSKVHGG